MYKVIAYTLITVVLDLLIASFIFILLLSGDKHPIKDLFDFISKMPLIFGTVMLSLIVASFYIGSYMNNQICYKNKDSTEIGIIGMMIILIIGILSGSTVGFFQYGILTGDNIIGSIINFYVGPLFWILLFGLLPTLISGWTLGSVIKKNRVTTT